MKDFGEILKNIKINNYLYAIFYPSIILFFGSLFYGKTYVFSNEQIAKFSMVWIVVSLIGLLVNDMLSLLEPYSIIARQEGKKIFVDNLWWPFIVMAIHILIFGTGVYVSLMYFTL